MDISIIIPCYNAIGKVEACVDSLLKIDYPHDSYEVIFVDDCSEDTTFDYLKSVTKTVQNWSVTRLSENSGSPSAPRNRGIEIAKSDYVLFLDCDDAILPDTLQKHHELAIKTNADIVRGYLIVDNGKNEIIVNRLIDDFDYKNKQEKISTLIGKQSTTVVSLIKRQLLIDNLILWNDRIRMGEDTLFLIEVLVVSQNIEYIDHPTFIYNKKPNINPSSTQTYGSRELNNHLLVWKLAQQKLREVGLDYYEIRLQVGLQTAILSLIKYNSHDISAEDFKKIVSFVSESEQLIKGFNYSQRIKSVLESVYNDDYETFKNEIKPRLVIAGYDLKFITSAMPYLDQHYQIAIDEWTGHNQHDEKYSLKCLAWGEIIFCEWMLGNAVWYSNRVRDNQKLFIRMHRFELTTNWYKDIDFRKVNRVFAVSVYFFEKLIEYTKIPRAMACLLPNYLDTTAYQSANQKSKLYNLGIIGILPSRKGYLEALQVLKQLVAKNPKYRLFVFGKMPEDLPWIKNNEKEMHYYNQCKQFIIDNHLSEHVIVKGWVNVKTELKNVGFILSTSQTEELFESFHIAPADAFAAESQGLLLNWNGVEYIYPSKYIFTSIDELSSHIASQNSLDKFNNFSKEGRDLIKNRYSVENFIAILNKSIRLSEMLFKEAPYLINEDDDHPIELTVIRNRKLSLESLLIQIPEDFQKNRKVVVEYKLNLLANPSENAALISVNLEGAEKLQGFKKADDRSLGLYQYLNTINANQIHTILINLPKEARLHSLRLILWKKAADIDLEFIRVIAV